MVNIYVSNDSLSEMIRDKGMLPHLERSLDILSPWMVTIDSDSTNRSNSLDSRKTDYLLEKSSILERSMSVVAINRG
jgi:hypothetical protein